MDIHCLCLTIIINETGCISEYNSAIPQGATFDLLNLVYKSQRIEGFLYKDWLYGTRGCFQTQMADMINNKTKPIRVKETFFHGMESWPAAFQSLFTGEHVGKVVVTV